MNQTLTQKDILERLKRYADSAMLSQKTDLGVSNGVLHIHLSGTAVKENMQTDGSAFEAWSICIMAAIDEIKSVELSWDKPVFSKSNGNAEEKHYNRFLMRAVTFESNYEWFSIAAEVAAETSSIRNELTSGNLVLNFPKSDSTAVVDASKKPEAFLERKLLKEWQKEVPITDHQLPVGIFSNGEVCKANTLTPRGASQIDLWQLSNDFSTLIIYELKVETNRSIGIISELMFYANTMNSLRLGEINYPPSVKALRKNYRHIHELTTAVQNCEIDSIEAIFAAGRFHPLIENSELQSKILNILSSNNAGIKYRIKFLE